MDATAGVNASSATANPSLGALVVRDQVLAPQFPQAYPPAYGGEDPLAGGVDFRRVWHSFRRRWLPAVALGTLLAAVAATSVWFFMPRGFEAVAWLRVSAKAGMLGGGGRDSGEYEAYRKTQVTLIKSPFVLTSAMRRPGIADLPTLREQKEDPVGWLTRSIQVSAPMESEVVQVRLRGEHAADIAKIVNAVTSSYLEDIVNKERAENLGRRDALEKKYKENMAEMREMRETFNTLARTLGTRDSSEVATQRSLLLDHLGTLRSQLSQTQRDLTAIDAELSIIDAKARGEIASEDALPDEVVESAIIRDPQIIELGERLAAIEESILFQQQRSARGGNEPAVKRLRAQRDQVARRIGERRNELRPQIVAQLSLEGVGRRSGQVMESPVVLRKRRELIAAELAKARKEFEETADEVKQLGQANADLKIRGHEIEQLEAVTRQMGIQLETTEADISLPPRVTVYQEASKPEGNDRFMRAMLATLAGLAGLA